jgi:8-oxo-dGTP diphosphatase
VKENIDYMDITFTLCFIKHNNKYLMLYRNRPPHQYCWNGVGGKIENEELPLVSCQREILEETGLNIPLSAISFHGIVTWNEIGGMYVFLANSDSATVVSSHEGRLEWKTLDWILHSGESVSNIPLFLPYMLSDQQPSLEHAFTYNQHEEIISYEKKELHPNHIKGKIEM